MLENSVVCSKCGRYGLLRQHRTGWVIVHKWHMHGEEHMQVFDFCHGEGTYHRPHIARPRHYRVVNGQIAK